MSGRTIIWLVCFALVPSSAIAGGQFVGDNGSQGMQRAGAFVAKADDPTAIYYNPAGLVLAAARQFFVGANLVSMNQSFSRNGQYAVEAVQPGQTQPGYVGDDYPTVEHDGPPQPVPMIALTIPGKRYAIAAGLFAPHGYGMRNYPATVDTANGAGAPAPQRYDTVEQSARLVFPSLAIGYRVSDKLSVGGRLSYGFGSFQSRRFVQGVGNQAEDPGQDSDVRVDVSDNQIIAFGAGVHYQHSDSFALALVYSSAAKVDAVGSSTSELGPALREPMPGQENFIDAVPDDMARCAPGGTRDAIKSCLDLALPQTATVGVRWIARDRQGDEIGDIEIDVRWENWSAVSDYAAITDGQNSLLGTRIEDAVVRHGFQDVYSIRAGGAGRFERGGRSYEIRGGLAYDTAAAPPSWTRLDVDGLARVTAALGLGIELGDYQLDVGVAFIEGPRRNFTDVGLADPTDVDSRVQPDVTVPLNPADAQPYHPFNAGTYSSRYLVGSVGLTGSF